MTHFIEQYEWIKKTRELFFQYCETLKPQDYVTKVSLFGETSVRDLHLHVADCYLYWLGRFTKIDEGLMVSSQVEDVPGMREEFKRVDALVETFLATYKLNGSERISGRVGFQTEPFQATPLWLYTHTMTHEFHHKGQMVSMTRQLGYIPVDTDLIDPSLVD